MKLLCCAVLAGVAYSGLSAQLSSGPTPVPGPTLIRTNSIVERGQNHRVWQKVFAMTNAVGRVTYTTNSVTELANGLHYLGANGQWRVSEAKIQLLADGTADAVNGPHK